jgi:hypothetical protein
MSIGRRYELLLALAARNIPSARREELLELVTRWIESDACGVISHEELFYMLGGMAGIQMGNYSEDLADAAWRRDD